MPKTVNRSDSLDHISDLMGYYQKLGQLIKEQGIALSAKDIDMFNHLSKEITKVQEIIKKEDGRIGNAESWGTSQTYLDQAKVILQESYKENQLNIKQTQELMMQLQSQIKNIGRMEKYLPKDKNRQGRIIDKNV